MHKRIGLLLSVVALTLAVGGVALAATVDCGFSSEESPCEGTQGSDTIRGTDLQDYIQGRGGNDLIYGYRSDNGVDRLLGDDYSDRDADNVGRNDGDDRIYGGRQVDVIVGLGGSDFLRGNGGADTIDAREEDPPSRYTDNPGIDVVRSNVDNDFITAADGYRDVINCGKGDEDRVRFDQGLDSVTNCEILDPQ